MRDFYAENYKLLTKEIEEDLKNTKKVYGWESIHSQPASNTGDSFVWSTCIIEHLLCAILRAKFWGFKGEFHKQRQTCKPIMTKYKVLLHSKEEPMRLQRRLLDGILDDRGEQRGRKGRKGKSCKWMECNRSWWVEGNSSKVSKAERELERVPRTRR